MLRLFGHFFARNSCHRRLISAALLAAYIVTAAGIPLPTGAKPQASDESYPCANCGCGCASADQCWRSCCCHTLAERLAWAREHNVRPPAFAIADAQRAGLNLAWLAAEAARHSDSPPTTCCDRAVADTRPSCCQAHTAVKGARAERACCARRHDQPRQANTGDHIVGWRALACQGHSMNWLAAVPTLIVGRPEISYQRPLVAWLGPAVSEAAEVLPVIPELPPPERA